MLIKQNPLFIWARSSINRAGTPLVRVCDLWPGQGAQEKCFGCGVSSRLRRGHYSDGCFPMERALGRQAACSLFTSAPEGQHSPTPAPRAKPAVVLLFLLQLHFLRAFIVRVLPSGMWMYRTATASDSKGKLCHVCLT